MDTVISFTPSQLWAVIIAIAGGITAICVASGWIIKVIRAARKPNDTQNKRLADLEARVARHDELFAKDLKRLEKTEENGRVTLQALLAILNHEITGNDIKNLQAAKEAITSFLISK